MRGLAIVALGLLAASCSDATVSRASYDRPLFAFTGRFNPVATVGVSSLRVGVVWIDPLQVHDDLPAPPQTTRFEVTPGGYTVSFFAPPPASVIYAVDDPKTETLLTRFAFGEIVAYDDRDGNGTFAVAPRAAGSEILPPDVYVGASDGPVLRYLATPLPKSSTLLPELSGILRDDPGYALGLVVGCSPLDVPRTRLLSTESQVVLQVDQIGSVDLPFKRACLRTRAVPAQPTPPGPGP